MAITDDPIVELEKGVAAWNAWRRANPEILFPDLRQAHFYNRDLRRANLRGADFAGCSLVCAKLQGANLSEADFLEADLRGVNLSGANLTRANLLEANLNGRSNGSALGLPATLRRANLSGADLLRADLYGADLTGTNLSGASLRETNLGKTDLTGANLSGADLEHATMVDTILSGANLTGCHIYGISAWNLKLEATEQQNLIITPRDGDEPKITVDNIEVAQFIYLLLHNEKIRHVIDTITSKVVLILGRFTPERKAVLDSLREELRRRDYLPILFDFDKPASRDITETISLLARMAYFVLADITDARSIPQELNVIVPDLPSVAVQPLLLKESSEYGMFEHYTRFPWVLPIYRYETQDQDQLITVLGQQVIEPAERMASELRAGTKYVPVLQRKSDG